MNSYSPDCIHIFPFYHTHTLTNTQTHARIKLNQFPARRCTVLKWHKFLSWQRSDDFLFLTPWKCYKEVWRGLISLLFSHTIPSLWCLLFKEKHILNKTPKPKHACDMESSDASILTAPSALSSLLFVPLHGSNLGRKGGQMTVYSVFIEGILFDYLIYAVPKMNVAQNRLKNTIYWAVDALRDPKS